MPEAPMPQQGQQGNMFQNMMSFAKGMIQKPPQQQQQNQNQSQNINQNQNQNGNQNQNDNGNANVDPFKEYEGLFAAPDPSKTEKAPQFMIPEDVLTKASGSIDFMSGLPQELQDKLGSGEPLDTQTIVSLMSHASRNAYSKAMQHATNLTDKFVNQHSEFSKKGLSKDVQRVLASNSVSKIPGADNPLVRGFLEMTSHSLAEKYPDKDPQWVAEKAQKLFLDMAKVMTPGNKDESTTDEKDLSQRQDFNWDSYLGMTSNQQA